MNNKTLYKTLLITTGITLLLMLLEYMIIHNRNPLHRLGYATFISLSAALVTLVVVKSIGLKIKLGVVLTYLVAITFTIVIQMLIR